MTDAAAARTDENLAFRVDDVGQPVGLPVDGWTPRVPPAPDVLAGRYCRLEARDAARHDPALFAALHTGDPRDDARRWTYIPLGPFADVAAMTGWLDGLAGTPGTFPVVVLVDERVVGTASFMRTDVVNGTVEVGSIVHSPALQRSRAATEAMSVMARHVFEDLGYRRYEWKCDALNAPSRRAALRLGFTFEGVWRNAVLYKGRNRDTAWFAMTDGDWARLSPAYDVWLDPANFDGDGRQRTSLSALTAEALGR
jgi:RimJ/RimL family protein N-acetyltransferase